MRPPRILFSPADPDSGGLSAASSGYHLDSPLAKLCFPAAVSDDTRGIAWINSICVLFLAIGLLGIKRPVLVTPPVVLLDEAIPTVFEPPVQQNTPDPEPAPSEDVDEAAEPTETPQVVTLVAADPAAASFAVPVQGQVVLAPARVASAPPINPPKRVAPPKPPTLFAGAGTSSSFPNPAYPRESIRRNQQGQVMVEVMVDTNGLPTKVEIKESSRFTALDEAAAETIRAKWRWPAGDRRHYYVPIHFQLQ